VAPDIESLAPRDKYDWSRIAFAQTAGLETPGRHMWMPLMLMQGAEILKEGSTRNAAATDESRNVELFRARRGEGQPRNSVSAMEFGARGATMSGLIDQESVPLAPRSCYQRYKVTKFLKSTCLIHMGQPITRGDLVKNYANKYGGIHIEWQESGDDHRTLAQAGAGLTISRRNPVLYELLSIGQLLANSADTSLLREAAHAAGID
jgi:hypothetical protein